MPTSGAPASAGAATLACVTIDLFSPRWIDTDQTTPTPKMASDMTAVAMILPVAMRSSS